MVLTNKAGCNTGSTLFGIASPKANAMNNTNTSQINCQYPTSHERGCLDGKVPPSVFDSLECHPALSDTLLRAERTAGVPAVSLRTEGRPGVESQSLASSQIPSGAEVQTHSESLPKRITVNKCGSLAIFTECESGQHHFAKKLLCNQEWCPVCGEDGSQAHQRRIARWLPKFQQMTHLGYFVIEFPRKYRQVKGYVHSRQGIQLAVQKMIDVLAGKRCGRKGRVGGYFSRGLLRWHWFGDKQVGKWNPHMNVVVDAGHLELALLERIKADLRQALKCPDLIVHYSFVDTASEMYHKLKYITRATFRKREWDERMAGALWNFRNSRWWGRWDGEPKWSVELDKAGELLAVNTLGSGFCPDCGSPLKKWSQPIDSIYLKLWDAQEIAGSGYFRIPKGAIVDRLPCTLPGEPVAPPRIINAHRNKVAMKLRALESLTWLHDETEPVLDDDFWSRYGCN